MMMAAGAMFRRIDSDTPVIPAMTNSQPHCRRTADASAPAAANARST